MTRYNLDNREDGYMAKRFILMAVVSSALLVGCLPANHSLSCVETLQNFVSDTYEDVGGAIRGDAATNGGNPGLFESFQGGCSADDLSVSGSQSVISAYDFYVGVGNETIRQLGLSTLSSMCSPLLDAGQLSDEAAAKCGDANMLSETENGSLQGHADRARGWLKETFRQ